MKIAAGRHFAHPYPQRKVTTCLMIVVALAGAGCSGGLKQSRDAQTHVGYEAISPPGTERYVLNEDENATTPTQIENATPVYPAQALPMRLPKVTVSAKVIVDGEGKVSEVRIAHANAADIPNAFDAAVRDAVMQWRYQPLRIRQFEDVLDAQGNITDSRMVSEVAQPFSLDYEFYFELRDGKPIVDSSAASRKSAQ